MTSIALSQRRHAGPLPRPATMLADAGYLLVGLPIGIMTFTVAVTGLGLTIGLAITLLGIPVLLGTLYACRGLAQVERVRAAALLGTPVRGRERAWTGSVWRRTLAAAGDPAAWRDVLWSLLLLPIGIAGFAIAVSVWSTTLGLLASPLYYWALPRDDDTIALLDSTSLEWSALRVLIGLLLLPVAAWACRGLAAGTARSARAVLG